MKQQKIKLICLTISNETMYTTKHINISYCNTFVRQIDRVVGVVRKSEHQS